MRKYYFILLLLTSLISVGQSNDFQTINDTTFIIRTLDPGNYHAVFIDTSRTSQYYKRLSSFDGYDTSYNKLKSTD